MFFFIYFAQKFSISLLHNIFNENSPRIKKTDKVCCELYFCVEGFVEKIMKITFLLMSFCPVRL